MERRYGLSMELLGLRRKLGATMRKSRIAKGMTQEALAEKTLVSVSTVKRMEAGGNQPLFEYLRVLTILNPNTLRRLSDAIEFRPEDFAREPGDVLRLEKAVKTRKRVRT